MVIFSFICLWLICVEGKVFALENSIEKSTMALQDYSFPDDYMWLGIRSGDYPVEGEVVFNQDDLELRTEQATILSTMSIGRLADFWETLEIGKDINGNEASRAFYKNYIFHSKAIKTPHRQFLCLKNPKQLSADYKFELMTVYSPKILQNAHISSYYYVYNPHELDSVYFVWFESFNLPKTLQCVQRAEDKIIMRRRLGGYFDFILQFLGKNIIDNPKDNKLEEELSPFDHRVRESNSENLLPGERNTLKKKPAFSLPLEDIKNSKISESSSDSSKESLMSSEEDQIIYTQLNDVPFWEFLRENPSLLRTAWKLYKESNESGRKSKRKISSFPSVDSDSENDSSIGSPVRTSPRSTSSIIQRRELYSSQHQTQLFTPRRDLRSLSRSGNPPSKLCENCHKSLRDNPKNELSESGENNIKKENVRPKSHSRNTKSIELIFRNAKVSPKSKGSSPRSEGASPRTPSESPRENKESSRIRIESPREDKESPRIRIESPREEKRSPRIGIESPRDNGKKEKVCDEGPRNEKRELKNNEDGPALKSKSRDRISSTF